MNGSSNASHEGSRSAVKNVSSHVGSTIGFCGSMGLRRGCSSWGLRFCPLDLKCCPRLFLHPSGVHRDGAARWGVALFSRRDTLDETPKGGAPW